MDEILDGYTCRRHDTFAEVDRKDFEGCVARKPQSISYFSLAWKIFLV